MAWVRKALNVLQTYAFSYVDEFLTVENISGIGKKAVVKERVKEKLGDLTDRLPWYTKPFVKDYEDILDREVDKYVDSLYVKAVTTVRETVRNIDRKLRT